MTCQHCGATLPDGSRFCSACGKSVEPPAQDKPAEMQAAQDAPEKNEPVVFSAATGMDAANNEPASPAFFADAPEQPVRKPLGKRLWLLLGAAAVALVVVLAVIVNAVKRSNYEAAVALFDAGGYAEAAEAFAAMGNYEDAEERAATSLQWADYTRACGLMEPFDRAKTEEAEGILLALGAFQDAAEKATLCRNELNYDAAKTLEANGSYAEAKAAFAALGAFRDAAEHVKNCENVLNYQEASALIDTGEYAAAAELLATPAEREYADSAELLALCNNKVDYAAADEAYAAGRYYEAYKSFTALGLFEDAATRAEGCVQAEPGNGETYRNSAYPTSGVKLTVVNSGSSGSYLKLYSSRGDLVCSFYIRGNKRTSIKVPAGTYSLNRSYGKQWFGETDMFGDDGTYYVCKFGGNTQFTMERGYNYTISSGGRGDPVTTNATDRGAF